MAVSPKQSLQRLKIKTETAYGILEKFKSVIVECPVCKSEFSLVLQATPNKMTGWTCPCKGAFTMLGGRVIEKAKVRIKKGTPK